MVVDIVAVKRSECGDTALGDKPTQTLENKWYRWAQRITREKTSYKYIFDIETVVTKTLKQEMLAVIDRNTPMYWDL